MYAPAVSPAPAQAVRPSTSISSAFEVADVEDDPALDRAVAGAAVAAGADRQLEAGLAGERDHLGDVVGVGDPDDDARAGVDAARA